MDELLKDDYQCEGQINIYDIYEQQNPSNSLIAVSRIFARAIKKMNIYEWKAFVSALSHIKWKDENKNVVVFDKMSLASQIGIETDINHVNRELKKHIGELVSHSHIEFDASDQEGGWANGDFISVVDSTHKGYIAIHFTPYFMPLFQKLSVENNYITIWADDIFKMKNEYSILFYEELRLHTDVKSKSSHMQLGTKKLKELFNMPKDGKGSYTRKNGKFDRTGWEKNVLDVVCNDMQKCSMINIIVNEDGKLYRKIKDGAGHVKGYEFEWTYSKHPRISTATEIKELQERIDKDPKTLKIAKDLAKGKKKVKNQNKFNDFEQNTYDFAELEEKLLDN